MAQFEVEPVEKWVKPSKTTGGDFDFTDCDNLLAREYTQGNKIQLVRNITPSGASAQEVKLTDGTTLLLINEDRSVYEGFLTLATANRGSVGTTAIGTVPAGKVWDVYFATNPILNANADGEIQLDGVKVSSALIGAAPVGTDMQLSKPVRLTAGKIVNLVVSRWTSGTIYGTIGYVERNA